MDDQQRFDLGRYKHWIEDSVRFGDLDALGHVNNNSVGQYFENARAFFFRKITPTWPHHDQLFVLGRSAIDFRRELHFPAPIKVGTGVASIGRTSMVLVNALFSEGKGIAYCENVSVLINQKTRQPIEIPQDLRELLKPFAA